MSLKSPHSNKQLQWTIMGPIKCNKKYLEEDIFCFVLALNRNLNRRFQLGFSLCDCG